MRSSHCAPCILYNVEKHRCLQSGRYIRYMSECAAEQIRKKVREKENEADVKHDASRAMQVRKEL